MILSGKGLSGKENSLKQIKGIANSYPLVRNSINTRLFAPMIKARMKEIKKYNFLADYSRSGRLLCSTSSKLFTDVSVNFLLH